VFWRKIKCIRYADTYMETKHLRNVIIGRGQDGNEVSGFGAKKSLR